MPHVKKHTFGPGVFESMTLTTWVGKSEGKAKRWHARLEGTYTVYCGNGNEHGQEIKITEIEWSSSDSALGRVIAYAHEEEVNLELVDNMLNWALEDWSDPCEAAEL